MNFCQACFAAPKSKHSNKQMDEKPSPTPLLFQVWCDGTCIAVCYCPSVLWGFFFLPCVKNWSCDSHCERCCAVPTLCMGFMGSLGISVLEKRLCTSPLVSRGNTGSDSLESWHIASISKRIHSLEIAHIRILPLTGACLGSQLSGRIAYGPPPPCPSSCPDSVSIPGEQPWSHQSLSK